MDIKYEVSGEKKVTPLFAMLEYVLPVLGHR